MPLQVSHAETSLRDPVEAVDDLRRQFGDAPLDAVVFFCDPDYDLAALGPALKAGFDGPVVGCTSAGQLGPGGFQRCGILAVAMRGGRVRMQPFAIAPLSDLQTQAALTAAAVHDATEGRASRCFALLLVDGLSYSEEYLAAALYQGIGNIPLVGGSAGDDLRFERTHVYVDGQFRSDAAVLALFESEQPFEVMKLQHFVASDIELVVTEADPYTRLIRELEGEPAAEVYAAAIGCDPAALRPDVFSTHPLVLDIRGEPYVRSIQRVNPDMSLTCYCAVEEGVVLSVGRAVDELSAIEAGFRQMRQVVHEPALVLGCDCILRRLEFEQSGLATSVGRLMAEQKVFGFSTYGEQFNGLHVNQTFTGVAIGR